ncbi:hypothetical protein ACIRBX_26650 [Kitasatospora sp. NPDC096147]|uniref:hypothetical protein n=1 Tax=Kitasatospora sp. NPDC096147 TaxID=3364093 RepID=UPI003805BA6C
MARWTVFACPVHRGIGESIGFEEKGEFEGTEEEALAWFAERAGGYTADRKKVRRREVFKSSDRSYFVRLHGRFMTTLHVLRLTERISDTGLSGPTDAPDPFAAPGTTD